MFADNLVLSMTTPRNQTLKIYSTSKDDRFKVIKGLADSDKVIHTEFCDNKDARQLMFDYYINGYELILNNLVKGGIAELLNEYTHKKVDDKIFYII